MQALPVDAGSRAEFLRYCTEYGADNDESFIPDAGKVPHPDYPAYLLRNDGRAAGAACLVRTPPFVADHKGRFMIFHTSPVSADGYEVLLDAMRPHFAGLARVYLFVPEECREVREIWEDLGFSIERRAYLLVHRSPVAKAPVLPDGFLFRAVSSDDPVAITAAVDLDNLNFAGQPGHVEYSVGRLVEDLASDTQIEGGLMMVYDRERPVGTVWVSRDEEGSSEVAMVTVHPDYRGRGLGRALLRQAIALSQEHGLATVYLSVSAENEPAVQLYLSEGFAPERVMVCYQMFMA